MQEKKCDWIGCSEIGLFDGLDKMRLTEEGKRHIFAFLKLIFLCPYHFKRGVGNSDEDSMAAAKRSDEIMARSKKLLESAAALQNPQLKP